MASSPLCERPPKGLDAWWTKVWLHALKVLREQGTWAWELKPLLDEYVDALREAREARELARADSYRETEQGLLHPHPGFAQADRAARRAVALADALVLSPASRKAIRDAALKPDDKRPDPASAFDDLDEVGVRRRKRASA